MNRRIALRLIGAVAAAALLAFDSAATSLAQTLTAQQHERVAVKSFRERGQ
jgi:hypothetical protein